MHKAGQCTYYAGSGIETAKAEKYGDPLAPVTPGDVVFQFPEGNASLFDGPTFIAEHPERADLLAVSGTGKWEMGQELRDALQSLDCSGAYLSSTMLPGGINVIVWPLDGKPLPETSFTLRPDPGHRAV